MTFAGFKSLNLINEKLTIDHNLTSGLLYLYDLLSRQLISIERRNCACTAKRGIFIGVIIYSKFDLMLHFGGENMGNLGNIGIFFAGFFGGFGIFFIGCAFLWWCSLYAKLNLPKKRNK
jgi:hypothetical protein